MLHNLFDTHAHYDDKKFSPDRDAVLSSLPEQGIVGVMNAAADLKSCKKAMELADQYDFVTCAVGIHPHSATEYTPDVGERLAQWSKGKKVVAIGEIGLDYHYDFSPRDVQRSAFCAQLALAKDLGMPVVLHDREAHEDMYAILHKYRPKAVLHCYSGSAEMVRQHLPLDLYYSFGGALTFKNARKALEAAAAVPLDRLMLETDCPYMAPVPYRGQRCHSGMLQEAAVKLAEIRQMDVQTLVDKTTENARAFFQFA